MNTNASERAATRCISIDDEALGRKGLALALAPYKDFELVGEYGSGSQLLQSRPENIDVAFIDIEMPRMNGFKLLQSWGGPLPLFVFVTAYDHYAVQAFEQQALDYVLKPIDETRFAQVIERIRTARGQQLPGLQAERLQKLVEELKLSAGSMNSAISVKTSDGYLRIQLLDILYLESVGDHVCLHLRDRQVITRYTLRKFAVELAEHGFQQIHKSFLVNTTHIQEIGKLRFGDYQVLLSNNAKLRLSRRYRAALMNEIAAAGAQSGT